MTAGRLVKRSFGIVRAIADDTVETNFLFVQLERDAALIEGLT